MEFKFEYIFFAIFALVIISFIFSMFKHGGFKAALFGASIKNKIGEVNDTGQKMMNVSLRVHELDSSPEKLIGLELVAKSFGSYQMTPITLSKLEAEKLIELISSVTNKN